MTFDLITRILLPRCSAQRCAFGFRCHFSFRFPFHPSLQQTPELWWLTVWNLKDCYQNSTASHHAQSLLPYTVHVWGRGTPLPPLSIYFFIFSPFYFFLSFLGFTYFLLLSTPSLSTRIVPLRFQAGGRRRRPNLGLVFCVICVICIP